METGFTKADNRNLPKVDMFMICNFFASNSDFCDAEFRNVKTSVVRFIWGRFGAIDVIRPELVIETSTVRIHENYNSATGSNNIALVNLNRYVEETANIAPIALRDRDVGFDVNYYYCGYGQGEQDTAVGERLSCWDVFIVGSNDFSVIVQGQGISATEFYTGSPLVRGGNLIGLLDRPFPGFPEIAVFERTSPHINWISGMTGVDFDRTAPKGPQDVIVN